MSKAKVSVRQLYKRYGATLAADHIDLDIREGEFLTLLGASGCGKTTLMRMIAGLETADSGSIVIDGKDVTHLPPRQRRLGMVFQQYSLFPHMTIEENVGYGLRAQKVDRATINARVQEMLELIQLPHVRRHKPGQLSGGQQQRVALARALATRPSVLMLDEPLGALDLKLRRQLQTELKHIHRSTGSTFLFVTHDQEEALYMSDRIAVMRAGKIEQLDTPEQIYLEPASEFVADFVGDVSFIEGEYDPAVCCLMLGDGMIKCELDHAGGAARVAVRPEGASLTTDADASTLPGVIAEVAQQTGTTLYRIALSGGQEIKVRSLGVVHAATMLGQPVRVRVDRCALVAKG
ncbi:MAG TPA: ABC transporter ATP-binding protein [Eoetvoesiella sp.]|uniref:ABC transporter ATP-binding protein n=1 Tax=Eoetvoesiella sp. TaxID=1966355 RepID=UPI002CBB077D|nr:ABC transporter ATP-binding protein [Eoetvoesiella sp.]HWK61445.1 ABC transporter ATP-binding protein [Eoetvoesiella sp.]